MKRPDVLILLGSASDEEYLAGCVDLLKEMQIGYQVRVASAHRTPERVSQLIGEFSSHGKVIICFAGHAAHLAGFVAAQVCLPVLAVPLPTSDLDGIDSLLASVQMPGGIPVATLAIGSAGSRNAGCLAAQILSLSDEALAKKYRLFRESLKDKVLSSSKTVEQKWECSE